MNQKIALIAATLSLGKSSGVYGVNGRLPWQIKQPRDQGQIKKDMKRFVDLTTEVPESVIVLGRKSYESLPKRELPGRKILVLSSQKNIKESSRLALVNKPENIIERAQEVAEGANIFFAGGYEVWKSGLPYYTHVYITLVEAEYDYEGDEEIAQYKDLANFEVRHHQFREVKKERVFDEKSGLSLVFTSLQRQPIVAP